MTISIRSRDLPVSHWVKPQLLLVLGLSVLLAGCVRPGGGGGNRPDLSKKVVSYGQKVPKGGGHYKIGKPYQIANKWYRPRENTRYDKVGTASWYGDLFHGRKTANGEVFDMDALTAAHPTLPLPTLVEVTNLANGRSLVVRVNDRGPYKHNRLIDLSRKAATILGFKKKGTARVRVRYVGRAPLNGDDSFEKRVLARTMQAKRLRTRRRADGSYRRNTKRMTGLRTYSEPYSGVSAASGRGYVDRDLFN